MVCDARNLTVVASDCHLTSRDLQAPATLASLSLARLLMTLASLEASRALSVTRVEATSCRSSRTWSTGSAVWGQPSYLQSSCVMS